MQKTETEKRMLQIKKWSKSKKFKSLINLLEDHKIATFSCSLKEDFTEDELLSHLIKYLKQQLEDNLQKNDGSEALLFLWEILKIDETKENSLVIALSQCDDFIEKGMFTELYLEIIGEDSLRKINKDIMLKLFIDKSGTNEDSKAVKLLKLLQSV